MCRKFRALLLHSNTAVIPAVPSAALVLRKPPNPKQIGWAATSKAAPRPFLWVPATPGLQAGVWRGAGSAKQCFRLPGGYRATRALLAKALPSANTSRKKSSMFLSLAAWILREIIHVFFLPWMFSKLPCKLHFLFLSFLHLRLKSIPLDEEDLSTVLCSKRWGITCFQKDRVKKNFKFWHFILKMDEVTGC